VRAAGRRCVPLAAAGLFFLWSACSRPPRSPADLGIFRQVGEASWYGPTFHGKTTANGERYNMLGMTAAHRTLPFNTLVRVTNLANGFSAVVRINDRGPFLKGRILDLSYKAARALGANSPGVIRVRLEVVGKAPTSARPRAPLTAKPRKG
jgi:peptidoglycan lytic transglycosylase